MQAVSEDRWIKFVWPLDKNSYAEHELDADSKGQGKSIKARELFSKIINGAWRNGEPGMVFLDRINEDNHVIQEYGPMIATNPCGEQPLLGNESCNLGSINLAKFFINKDIQFEDGDNLWKTRIDWDRLQKVTSLAVNFLDNVIDANEYATWEIEEMTKATRKIGLGVMGFADLLIQLRIPYNSEIAREVAHGIIRHISAVANEESLSLAVTRGEFPAFGKSTFNPITEVYRNACRMTVAPTGTISMIAGCSSGVEPIFSLAFRKQNILEGKTLYYVDKNFEAIARERNFYSKDLLEFLSEGGSLQNRNDVPVDVKEIFKTAPDISPENHVRMQAAFQKSVDAGISKTINWFVKNYEICRK